MQHTYNKFIQNSYNTKLIQQEKHNIRWALWVRVKRHCTVTYIKVPKVTTKTGETSSLIRNIYIEIYNVTRTNRYIVMSASRGVVSYRGATEYLSEHVYKTPIQHEIHTTHLYNTPVQHANRQIKRKRKTSFY